MTVSSETVLAGEAMAVIEPQAHREASSGVAGQAAVLIWNDIAPEGREEFYGWHDKEHMPERLALPGFRRGRRLRRAGHSPEWLTVYEAADLSALVSPEYLAALNAPTPATVGALKHFRNTSRAVCRLVLSVGSSIGGHVLAMRLGMPGEQESAMRRYLEEAFARAVSGVGVVACHLYAADRSASYVDTAESSTRKFDVPAWTVLCEATTPDAAERARNVIDGGALARLGVEVRSDAAVYALEVCRLSSALRW